MATWHRYQHLYLWFLYGLLTCKWLVFADFSNLARRQGGSPTARRRGRLALEDGPAWRRQARPARLGARMLILFPPWWAVARVSTWLARGFLGLTLSVIFQLAHCVDTAKFAAT